MGATTHANPRRMDLARLCRNCNAITSHRARNTVDIAPPGPPCSASSSETPPRLTRHQPKRRARTSPVGVSYGRPGVRFVDRVFGAPRFGRRLRAGFTDLGDLRRPRRSQAVVATRPGSPVPAGVVRPAREHRGRRGAQGSSEALHPPGDWALGACSHQESQRVGLGRPGETGVNAADLDERGRAQQTFLAHGRPYSGSPAGHELRGARGGSGCGSAVFCRGRPLPRRVLPTAREALSNNTACS